MRHVLTSQYCFQPSTGPRVDSIFYLWQVARDRHSGNAMHKNFNLKNKDFYENSALIISLMVSFPLRSWARFADLTPLRSHEITTSVIPGQAGWAVLTGTGIRCPLLETRLFYYCCFWRRRRRKNIKTITLLFFSGAEGAGIFF